MIYISSRLMSNDNNETYNYVGLMSNDNNETYNYVVHTGK